MGKLDGKVAIVSGSGRGIGKAIALKLVREGARVVINDIDAGPAAETMEDIRTLGGEAKVCVGDITQADFGTRFVATAVEAFGGLDIIVNNAGYTWDNVIQKMSDDQFQAMLDVHAVAPFRILRAAPAARCDAAKREASNDREVLRKTA
jgi:3-oxoacyl-[acyl-carrier protein] reductase